MRLIDADVVEVPERMPLPSAPEVRCGEHYARTYKDDFTRHFPDCPKFKNGTPTACRDSIYPTTESGCKTGNCDICWMAVMPETDTNIGDTADRCVCCGDVIPEGRQVCPGCEGGVGGW
jgi:hypothetical protein